jgi:pyruvate/2-oxoglutarate dehydrogenase complex dihydrolipoamide acyltransferase (E2) component
VTPLARRLAAENDLDLTVVAADVRAKGATRIGRAEVEAALAARGAASPSARLNAHGATDPFPGERVPFNAIRRRTAERLAESWRTIPHAYQAVEVDFSAVDAVRQARKAAFAERHGAALTYLPFVARAISIAIADFPHVNARLDGGGLIVLPAVNLGIAVDLAGQGLVVPVVKDAGGLTVTGLAKAIARLVERARSNALLPDDLAGGTYTISNNGAFGTLLTAPIINPPEVAILSMDTVSRKIVVVGDDDSAAIAIRPVGTLVQSFDHRAFDGAYSASFLRRVRLLIERHDWDAEVS